MAQSLQPLLRPVIITPVLSLTLFLLGTKQQRLLLVVSLALGGGPKLPVVPEDAGVPLEGCVVAEKGPRPLLVADAAPNFSTNSLPAACLPASLPPSLPLSLLSHS